MRRARSAVSPSCSRSACAAGESAYPGQTTAPLLALALAASEILLPPWPLAPDGELVGVRGDARLAAEGGAVEAVAPGLWRVVPAPGAARVVVRAGRCRGVRSGRAAAGAV